MARVELSAVHKHYGDVHVVKGVSLAVEKGEFLVLVGPSGCGKSTCLRMIAGLESISEGELRIGDRVVNEVEPKDRNIGMVFQSYALYPHMSVRQNLGFGLTLRKVEQSIINERIDEAAKILDLESLLDRRPKQLSGGQRQRVAIGRAIVKQPDVFLFDEPLSNLDAALRVQMRTEIAKLHQRLATTMVYVTHDQVEAMMLADRIAILRDGVLQQVGSPMEVFRRPANRFVAGFIGSPAMNFLSGEVSKKGDVAVVRCGDLVVETPGLTLSVGTKVELGVRPQDIELRSEPGPAHVTLTESLGWEAFVHLDVAGQTLVARVEGTRGDGIEVGDQMQVVIPSTGTHIFDTDGDACWIHPEASA